jgi:hypothetical protein
MSTRACRVLLNPYKSCSTRTDSLYCSYAGRSRRERSNVTKVSGLHIQLGEFYFYHLFDALLRGTIVAVTHAQLRKNWCQETYDTIYTQKTFPDARAQTLAAFRHSFTCANMSSLSITGLSVLYRPARCPLPAPVPSWLRFAAPGRFQIILDPARKSDKPDYHAKCFCYVLHEIGHLTDPHWSLISSLSSLSVGLLPHSSQSDEDNANSFANGFIAQFNRVINPKVGNSGLPFL